MSFFWDLKSPIDVLVFGNFVSIDCNLDRVEWLGFFLLFLWCVNRREGAQRVWFSGYLVVWCCSLVYMTCYLLLLLVGVWIYDCSFRKGLGCYNSELTTMKVILEMRVLAP